MKKIIITLALVLMVSLVMAQPERLDVPAPQDETPVIMDGGVAGTVPGLDVDDVYQKINILYIIAGIEFVLIIVLFVLVLRKRPEKKK